MKRNWLGLILFSLFFYQYSTKKASIPAVPFPVVQKVDIASTISNGVLTLKIDTIRGGAISFLDSSGLSPSIINIYDDGRYIQQSYYAGNLANRQSEGQSAAWSPWPWNPVQAGDYAGIHSQMLIFQKTGNELYTKCIPMLWDMNNIQAQAIMEQWTTLQGSVVKVHCRPTCLSIDKIYECYNQQPGITSSLSYFTFEQSLYLPG